MQSLLRDLGAPPSLVSWLDECEDDPDPPWEMCGRADWAVWIAACQGVHFSRLLAATTSCIRTALDASVGGAQILHRVLTLLDESRDLDNCERASELCRLALNEVPASYRTGPGKCFPDLVDATDNLLNAAKMLCALTARRQSQAELDALHRATAVGVPPVLMAPLHDVVVRIEVHLLDDTPAASEEAAFLASLSHAIRISAKTLSRRSSNASQCEANETLADEIYDLIYGG